MASSGHLSWEQWFEDPPSDKSRVTETELFDLVIHHGGKFVEEPALNYVGGRVQKFKSIDPDYFCCFDVMQLVKQLKYLSYKALWWKIPGHTLSTGRQPLQSDADVRNLVACVKGHAYIEIFVEHKVNLSDFLTPILRLAATANVEDVIEVCAGENLQQANHGSEQAAEKVRDDVGLGKQICWSDDDVEVGVEVNYSEYVGDDGEHECDVDEEGSVSYDEFGQDGEYDDHWEWEIDAPADSLVLQTKQCEEVATSNVVFDEGQAVPPDWTEEDEDSEELYSPEVSSDEEVENDKGDPREKPPKYKKFPRFKKLLDGSQVRFKIGLDFGSKDIAKDAIHNYGLCEGKPIWIDKDDKKRLVVRCRKGCPYYMRVSLDSHRDMWQVRRLIDTHTCPRQFKNPQAKTNLLGVKFMEKVRENPNVNYKDLQMEAKKAWGVHLSRGQAYRAKRKALALVEGTSEDQYRHLRSYGEELLRSNKVTSVVIAVIRPNLQLLPKFQRLYVCFQGCKKAFIESCRPLIGLDGCFLKGMHGGQLLAAIGKDGNKQMFPIAFAIVEAEVKDSWEWFLERLINDLGSVAKHGWSFISDQQKGLEYAVPKLQEGIEHRLCVKHLVVNFRKKFLAQELRSLVWEAARATTAAEFQNAMNRLKLLDSKAWAHMMGIPAATWSRSAFSTHSKCHLQVNNMCEAFNKAILQFRDKPIVQLVEDIRHYLMEKFVTNKMRILRHKGHLCPRIEKMLEEIKQISNAWTPIWAGDEACALFEVEKKPERFVVNLAVKSCSCRLWDLTGIPCSHSVAAMAWCNHKPEDYVHYYYRSETFLKCYSNMIYPINGPNLWPTPEGDPIQPPILRRPPGRPKKKRVRDPDEECRNPNKLPRQHAKYKCSKCKKFGHNSRSCKGKTKADREIPVGGNKAAEEAFYRQAHPSQNPSTGSQQRSQLTSTQPSQQLYYTVCSHASRSDPNDKAS